MATGSWAKGRLDWADAVVPLAASICFVIKQGSEDPVAIVGGGIGYALSVAVPFIGARQVIWAVNRRQPDPRPRQPLVAAISGILIWAFILFH
jgi:hypothetical protein